MAFTWKRLEGRLFSPEQMMRIIIEVADELGMPDRRGACICAGMCMAQEADFWIPGNNADPAFAANPGRFPHDSMGNDGRSVGPYQQQTSDPPPATQWGWGGLIGDPEGCRKRMDPRESSRLFLAALKRNGYNAANAQAANDSVQKTQQSGVPQGYKKHWDRVNALYDSVKGGAPPPASATYGMPKGTRITYGAPGFPEWVYQLAAKFGVQASTYAGHQESHRNEAGFAPNHAGLNRGIDWSGSVDNMQRLADYLLSIRGHLEQVIWQNPNTGRRIGVAGGNDVSGTGYYNADYAGHRDHVHSRQSKPIPIPGAAPPPPSPPAGRPFGAHRRGNALWLADALRAEGLRVVEYPGWREKSNGNNFDEISGVIMHHTGANNASAASIFNGRPDLRGPLSQIHLARDGTVTVVAAGCANHAGTGALPWLPKGTGNRRTIGIEAANDGGGTPGKPHRSSWPEAQYNAYVRLVKVILHETGWGADRVASHQEYDKGDPATFEGKWDPGAIDMNIFRADVARLALTPPPPQPIEGFLMALSDQEQRDLYNAIMNKRRSRSPLREPDEGEVGDTPDQIWDMDGSIHILVVFLLASIGHPGQLALLRRVAAITSPDRLADAELAQHILDAVTAAQHILAAVTAAKNGQVPAVVQAEPQVVYVQPDPGKALMAADVEPAAKPELTTGHSIGQLFDALERMRLADSLPIETRAPLAALISVLNTKNGAQL